MKLSIGILTFLVLSLLTGCGAATSPEDTADDGGIFKRGASKGQRLFTESYDPGARTGLDGLWRMQNELADEVDAIQIYEEEEVLVYARRCRFPSGLSLYTSIEVDIDLTGNSIEVLEDAEYTAVPENSSSRVSCSLALVEDLKIYFRVDDKDMVLSSVPSMRNPVRFYEVRDNR